MANESLTRRPTSTGNRRVYTLAFWIKRTTYSTFQSVFSAANTNNVNETFLYFIDGILRLYQADGAGSALWSVSTPQSIRDSSAMCHAVISVDTTQALSSDRVKIYINGVLSVISSATYPTINFLTNINTTELHKISGRPSGIQFFEGYLSDFFFVDGQALTPDVFGFNKQGKGYISVGSTQATDFRPGQWVPKTPRVIKTEINRRGGFGVNGFYLPMNDSNNFGADFHCDPNSIIKLNEELPQPRVGVATTASVGLGYTDVLRTDPYAANLVLALPFVSGGLNSGFGDYAPSIKGSGSAKVGTLGNSPSIGNTAGYYGSVLSINGTGSATGGSPVITFASNADFNFGSSPYTIECWLNPSTNTNHDAGVVVVGDSGAQTAITYTNGIIRFRGPTGSVEISSPTYPQVNQWFHTAIVRETGSTIKLYVDGVCVGIKTNFTSTLSQDKLNIGAWTETGTYGFKGQIQDVRVYKGVAKYTGGFDVPKPYTPVGIATWRAVPDTTANNFATLNPLTQLDNNNITYTNGNLTGYVAANANSTTSTIGISSSNSQKYYAEFRATSNSFPRIGVIDATVAQQGISASGSGGASANNLNTSGVISWGGTVNELFINSGTGVVNGGYNTNDIIGVAYDSATRNVWFSKNGTWQNFTGSGANPATGTNPVGAVNGSDSVYFGIRPENSNIDCNFGQNPTFSGNVNVGLSTFTDGNGKGMFRYQPPSGFLALCEDNLPTPAISNPGQYFKTVLWTGDGSGGRSIVGVGFTPDLVWVKGRNATYYHEIYDSIRRFPVLFSNATDAEIAINTLNSFNSDGFTVSKQTGYDGTNQSGQNYVAWCWRAGAGTTSTNTNGSITSVVSVNQDAGFSVVSYTGNGTAGATIGHGLGKAPKFILIKRRSGTSNWAVAGSILGSASTLYLNLTNQLETYDIPLIGNIQTSTTFQVGTDTNRNASGGTHIAYCWAEIEGFSKFGSYVGNGSADGPFAYCGFKPAWLMFKRTDSVANWLIFDSGRNSTNPNLAYLAPNATDIESTSGGDIDFLSNGFKIRNTAASLNASGGTYIFAAFAESPFTTSNAK